MKRLQRLIALTLWSMAFSCHAAGPAATDDFDASQRISDDELAELRGGFVTSDGLEINVGLEQLVLINGTLQSASGVDLSTPSREADAGKIINTIQHGANNSISDDVLARFGDGLFTIIQNSADGQLIQNYTVLNVAVSNASMFRADALGEALDLQLSLSLR